MELTRRLIKLKDRLFNVEFKDKGTWHFKDTNILDGHDELRSEPLVVRKAMAQEYMGTHLPAIIKADELIVGNPNQNSVGWGTVMPIYYTEEEGAEARKYQLNEASVWGHHPPEYEKVMHIGVDGVKEEINAAIARQLSSEKPDSGALNEYRAMLIGLDGLLAFAKRHAQEALKQALACKDEARKLELMAIYEACLRVPQKPARTLHEALQSYWFVYCLVNSGGEYVPLARSDQYLYPYYKEDLEKKRITKEHAIDLLGSFLVKCNERIIIDTRQAENHYNFGLFSQGLVPDEAKAKTVTGGFEQRGLTWQWNEDDNSEANFNYGQSGNDWLMNCIVGGQDRDGNDATNEVSHLFIELMHDLALLMPTLAARVHKNTPDSFYETIAKALRYGQGEPMVYNDDTIIPGFVDLGIPIEDARDYSNDGCWETLIPGKSHFSYAHVMNLRCLEWVLHRGVSLNNNVQEGLDTGDPCAFGSFDEFYDAYIKQLNAAIDFQCKRRLENFGLSFMIAPDPLFSSICDNCIEKGRDISQDGARYIFHLILVTGLSNTVDSLATVKKLVYEDRIIKMEDLIQALRDNWKGHERMRALVRNMVPKFGNDEDYVDSIAVRLLKDFEDRVGTWRHKQDTMMFPVGIGTFENYAVLGRDIGASPDGRGFGEQLAPNYTPTPGVDVNGPTAIFKSISKPELLRYYCGTPVDIAENAGDYQGPEGLERFKSLLKSFSAMGGQILTVTATSAEELRDAKVNPEMHQNLRVRMGGLSAYFIAMSPVQQENIIKRFVKGG
jgi:pyruvate-formate lyase